MDLQVLLLPGWYNSGPEHWQSRWEQRFGYVRVQQHDWARPLRGDWQIQLEEAVLQSSHPVVLVAHSLGCHLAAAWAAHSRSVKRVVGALLVAPPDLDREELRGLLPSWTAYSRQALPFASRVVASSNDPYAHIDFAAGLARDWGATWVDMGPAGHVNADSGLGDWPRGVEELKLLIKQSRALNQV